MHDETTDQLPPSTYALLDLVDEVHAYAYTVGWLLPRLPASEREALHEELMRLKVLYDEHEQRPPAKGVDDLG
jgi:hypothetical protein